jgi:hypothetical protein
MLVPSSSALPGAPLDAAVVDLLRAAAAEQVEPIERLRLLVGDGHLDAVPPPGQGATARRFAVLAEIGALDLSLARLAEGHLDALAILAEAGGSPRGGCYGVWAAERAGGAVRATPHPGAGPGGASGGQRCWQLEGVKSYASGAGRLDRALVTAATAEGPRLFDVDLSAGGVSVVAGTWPAVGMADSLSASVRFEAVAVPARAAVGGAGFYTARPGFWAGSVGVAACWYGGALGIQRSLTTALMRLPVGAATPGPAPHQLAHFGAVVARVGAMEATLAAAAAELDADPLDGSGGARLRALRVRHLVYEGCLEVLDHAARAGRTSLLTGDAAVARRVADLPVYLSQHHPDADLEALGRDALAGARSDGPGDRG